MNPNIVNLAAQLNIDPSAAEKLFAEAARQGLVVMGDSGQATPGGACFDRLKQFTRRQLAPSEAPRAFDEGLTAIGRTMELRYIPWEQAKNRPRIEQLPEAAFALADAKEVHPEMVVSSAAPQRLRYLASSVLLKRAFLEHAVSFARRVEADLADNEPEAATLVKDAYDPVRATAKRNRTIGPAQQGAETRTTGARMEKKLEAKVGPAAHARGLEEGVKLATSRIEGALDEMFAGSGSPGAQPGGPTAGPAGSGGASGGTGDRRGGSR